MKLKVLIGCILIAAMLSITTPVLALSIGVSPTHIEFEVPSTGSATIKVKIHYFDGDVNISLIDIPLRIEPETVNVKALNEPVEIELTIYGDKSLGSQIYNGYIRFIAVSGGAATGGVQVIAKITNLVEGEIPMQAVPEEVQETEEILTEEASTGESEESSPTPSSSFPVIPVAGIAAGTIVVITLIIVFARRAMY